MNTANEEFYILIGVCVVVAVIFADFIIGLLKQLLYGAIVFAIAFGVIYYFTKTTPPILWIAIGFIATEILAVIAFVASRKRKGST